MVSEESLRIREGLVSVREQTMTVANIQNMNVRQGPVQRLFGIADLEVHTAGGGNSGEAVEDGGAGGKQLHRGRFRGLEDAQGLRDRVRAALVRHRNAGLGDPDESHELEEPEASRDSERVSEGLVAAAARLAREARALRQALAPGPPSRAPSPDARAT